jgi:hypothetical protein
MTNKRPRLSIKPLTNRRGGVEASPMSTQDFVSNSTKTTAVGVRKSLVGAVLCPHVITPKNGGSSHVCNVSIQDPTQTKCSKHRASRTTTKKLPKSPTSAVGAREPLPVPLEPLNIVFDPKSRFFIVKGTSYVVTTPESPKFMGMLLPGKNIRCNLTTDEHLAIKKLGLEFVTGCIQERFNVRDEFCLEEHESLYVGLQEELLDPNDDEELLDPNDEELLDPNEGCLQEDN